MLSRAFADFKVLERINDLCLHEQFIIQSDAQKTFERIMIGQRITEVDKTEEQSIGDPFLEWVENDVDESHSKLNKLFFSMRQSDLYSYKRLSMKL